MKAIVPSAVGLAVLLAVAPPVSDSQWVQTSLTNVSTVSCFGLSVADTGSGTKLFAGTHMGAYVSSDTGKSWALVDSGLPPYPVASISILRTVPLGRSGHIFAGTVDGLFRSTDNGSSWTSIDSGLTHYVSKWIQVVAVSDSNVFAGYLNLSNGGTIQDGGIFRTTNTGASWAFAGLNQAYVNGFGVMFDTDGSAGKDVFAGTTSGVFMTPDDGVTWSPTNRGLTDTLVTAIGVVPAAQGGSNELLVGTQLGHVFRSTNFGSNWVEVDSGLPNAGITSFAVSRGNIFAGLRALAGGVYLSTNNGTSWSAMNTGLTDRTVWSLGVVGAYLLAGTENSVWRRLLSDMMTGVGGSSPNTPAVFRLFQNYPNPFNPTTTIRYALPSRAHVLLTVFNILGQQVANLVDAIEDPGEHSVGFDGSGLASGVYFYRLRAGEYSSTRRLVLVR